MRYYLDVLLELPLAQRILFTVAVVLALAALDYALVYRGQAGRIEHATEEIELARLDEARLRAELGRLPQLRQEVAALRRELHSHVPRPGASSTPLENISAQAAIAGLEVIRFHPGEARPGEHFTEVPTEVELKGTFHDLLRFFEFSAGSHDVLNATDLAIGALAAEDGHTMLRIALEMATLRVPPEEADTAAEDGAIPETSTHAPAASPAPTSAGVDIEPLPRDPFQPYEAPAPPEPDEQPKPQEPQDRPYEPEVAPQFHAVGIVWEKRTAVALVKDAEGFGHVVQPGARLGHHRYRVKTITPCEVTIETTRNNPDSHETRLKLPRCGAFQGTKGGRSLP